MLNRHSAALVPENFRGFIDAGKDGDSSRRRALRRAMAASVWEGIAAYMRPLELLELRMKDLVHR